MRTSFRHWSFQLKCEFTGMAVQTNCLEEWIRQTFHHARKHYLPFMWSLLPPTKATEHCSLWSHFWLQWRLACYATPLLSFGFESQKEQVVGSGTMLQAGRSRDRIPMRSLDFSIYLILPVAPWPVVDSASNRNEYQKISWRVKGRPERKADNLTAINEPTV
jgi:hypothetical protein